MVDVSAGTRAMQADRYANLRAEMWGRMREWLRTRGRIPNDQRLIDDLVSPLYSYDASNRVQLEKKADMKKRGLPSPDSGDELAMTFAFPVPERPALGHPASFGNIANRGRVRVKTGNRRIERRKRLAERLGT